MSEPLLLQARYRSTLEKKVAAQLAEAGVSFEYEPRDRTVRYTVPARVARYLPDFYIGFIIETKGWFKTKDRQKLAFIKEQFPDLDIRLVFQRAQNKISKDSETTYAAWADTHGFKWADKGVVPEAWINEAKRKAKNVANSGKRSASKASSKNRSRASA